MEERKMPRYDDLDPTRSTPQAAAVVPADVDALTRSLETLRRDLLFARILGLVAVCVSLLLAGLVYQLSSRMQSTEREVRAIAPAIAQAADQKLSQLAPQLDARLGRFEETSRRIEQRISAAETGIVDRIRSEMPKVLDSYTQTKIDQMRREADQLQKKLTTR
jgi:hypothetical protein